MPKTKRPARGFAEQPSSEFAAKRKRRAAASPAFLQVPVTSAQKKLIERAASLSGLAIVEFVRISAESAARRVAETNELTVLGERDSLRFAEALLHPPAPKRRLRAAARRYKAMIGAGTG